jgi:hypothetical protein
LVEVSLNRIVRGTTPVVVSDVNETTGVVIAEILIYRAMSVELAPAELVAVRTTV